MPISCPVTLQMLPQSEFAQMDYQVMRLAFESQNALGRLCDEGIYQNDLADRIEAARLGPVRCEVPLTVSHRDYLKPYSMDLVLKDAAVYELKAVTKLVADHDAQLLHYILLWGAQHGKLINFRRAHVESRFVNTTLTPEARKQFDVELQRWREDDEMAGVLRSTFLALLEDWGLFLEIPLYLDALVHFLGGEQNVLRLVPLQRGAVPLGNQRLHLLTQDTAFRVTAITGDTSQYENHLSSLLLHSQLRACHWINMAHHRVQFVTLQKDEKD